MSHFVSAGHPVPSQHHLPSTLLFQKPSAHVQGKQQQRCHVIASVCGRASRGHVTFVELGGSLGKLSAPSPVFAVTPR